MNYKQMSENLDVVISQLQSGDVSLDDAVEKYKEASQLIKKMQTYLEKTENKIKKIKADFQADK